MIDFLEREGGRGMGEREGILLAPCAVVSERRKNKNTRKEKESGGGEGTHTL